MGDWRGGSEEPETVALTRARIDGFSQLHDHGLGGITRPPVGPTRGGTFRSHQAQDLPRLAGRVARRCRHHRPCRGEKTALERHRLPLPAPLSFQLPHRLGFFGDARVDSAHRAIKLRLARGALCARARRPHERRVLCQCRTGRVLDGPETPP